MPLRDPDGVRAASGSMAPMATSHQRRPGDKVPSGPADLQRVDAGLKADLQRLENQRKALEQRGGDTDVDAEVVAKMQPQLGNAAVQALLNRGTETARGTSAAEAAQEEAQEEDEDREKEDEKEAGEVERVLPSFTSGAGGGGSGGAPWAMGRLFGGDDDGDDGFLEVLQSGWRPMPVLPDPDEEAELEDVEAEDDADPDAVDLEGARAVLGEAPWRPALLSRGLRNARRLARRGFGPEALVDADGLDHALGRLRALLRFVAAHGDDGGAVLAARAATVAGEAAFPVAAGFAGATARAAALAEATTAQLDPAWVRVLEVALDFRARPLAEHAAAALAQEGTLAAPLLVARVIEREIAGVEVELDGGGHPAAVAALERAARVEPLPLVDLWEPPARPSAEDAALAAVDAILAAFTGEPDEAPTGLAPADIQALYRAGNLLVGALGAMQVEAAAAALATLPHAEPARVLGVLEEVDSQLRRAARRLVRAADELQGLLGTDEHDRVRAISAEALAVRGVAELLRHGTLGTLGRMLHAGAGAAAELPLAGVEERVAAGRTAEAREALAALRAGPREALHAGALLLRMGFPEDAEAHLDRAAELKGPLGLAALSLRAGLLLARERWADAETVATVQLGRATRREAPYALADAAISVASARFAVGASAEEWQAPLREAAAWLRRRDEGAALNLLVARWGEIEAGG